MISFLYIITLSFAWEVKSNSNGETLHWKESNIDFYINPKNGHISERDAEEAILQRKKRSEGGEDRDMAKGREGRKETWVLGRHYQCGALQSHLSGAGLRQQSTSRGLPSEGHHQGWNGGPHPVLSQHPGAKER